MESEERERAGGRGGAEAVGTRSRDGDGNEDGDGSVDENGDGGGIGIRDGDRYINVTEVGREKESKNSPSDTRGWVEEAREGVAPTSNQQPQPQDQMPQ